MSCENDMDQTEYVSNPERKKERHWISHIVAAVMFVCVFGLILASQAHTSAGESTVSGSINVIPKSVSPAS